MTSERRLSGERAGLYVSRTFSEYAPNNLAVLWGLAEHDPESISRLWIVAQYMAFKASVDFSGAKRNLHAQFRRTNKIPTVWKPASRIQVLWKKHEIKQKEFLEYWDYVEKETGEDLFEIALTADPRELINGLQDYTPIIRVVVEYKMAMSTWLGLCKLSKGEQSVESISLPPLVEARYNSEQLQMYPTIEEEIPF